MSVFSLVRPRGTIGVVPADTARLETIAHDIAALPQAFLSPYSALAFPTACIDGRPTVDGRPTADAPPTGEEPPTVNGHPGGPHSALSRSCGSLSPGSVLSATSPHCEGRADLHLAGGSISVWVGLMLSGGIPLPHTAQEALDSLHAMCTRFHAQGLPLATHRDDCSPPGLSGCGAADQVGAILDLIAQDVDAVADSLASWGFSPRQIGQLNRLSSVAQHAAPVLSNTGKRMVGTIEGVDAAASMVAHGIHNEVLALINTREGTSVNRHRVCQQLSAALPHREGSGESDSLLPQVFVVDTWIINHISAHLEAPHSFATAVGAFSAAALLALCGNTMRSVIL